MKNLYQHSIDLKKIYIDNTDKDAFSQKFINLPYSGYEVEELPNGEGRMMSWKAYREIIVDL